MCVIGEREGGPTDEIPLEKRKHGRGVQNMAVELSDASRRISALPGQLGGLEFVSQCTKEDWGILTTR